MELSYTLDKMRFCYHFYLDRDKIFCLNNHYRIVSKVVITYNSYRRCHLAIIKQLNRKTGIVYAYESHSYRDKETKQPRSTRRLIGKIDEETGEIVPTRGKKKITTTKESDVDTTKSKEETAGFSLDEIRQKDHQILELRREVTKLRKDKADLAAALEKMAAALREA